MITVSDRVHSGLVDSGTGLVLSDWLTRCGFVVTASAIPDGAAHVTTAVGDAIDNGARLILTTGGTGVTPRDQTPQAVAAMLSVQTPGVIEAIRAQGRASGVVGAILSRGVAGLIDGPFGRVFVATLPGSVGGVQDAVDVLEPVLGYLIDQITAPLVG